MAQEVSRLSVMISSGVYTIVLLALVVYFVYLSRCACLARSILD